MNEDFKKPELIVYQKARLEQGQNTITYDFGAKNRGSEEQLYNLEEKDIVNEAVKNEILSNVFIKLGINYPFCWILTNTNSHRLIDSLQSDWKPGDVDIIAGNFYDDDITPDLNFIVAIQIKIRRITSFDELKSFASGRGTKQSLNTVDMGFNKTLLIHFLVKEPSDVGVEQSSSWNIFRNSDFFDKAKACFGLIKNQMIENKERFGYGWMGWGQALGNDWKDCGSHVSEIIYDSPNNPIDNITVNHNKEKMKQSIKTILKYDIYSGHPIILYNGKF